MPNLQQVKQKVAAADAAQNTGGRMAKKVDAATKAMLTKKVNPNQPWDVILVVDRSGSMGREYDSGHVQDAVERGLAFAVLIDDDGIVPTIFFDDQLQEVKVSLDNFHGLLRREGISARYTTDLTAALRRVADMTGNGDLFDRGGGFGRRSVASPEVRKADKPVFVIIITDGLPDNEKTATDAIRRLSYRGVFVKFIFVGTNQRGLDYLDYLDDDDNVNMPVGVPFEQGGRYIDNVDTKAFKSLGDAPDGVFFESMFDEVDKYLGQARTGGLL